MYCKAQRDYTRMSVCQFMYVCSPERHGERRKEREKEERRERAGRMKRKREGKERRQEKRTRERDERGGRERRTTWRVRLQFDLVKVFELSQMC